MERSSDARALERLGSAELLDAGHETRHLNFSEIELLAAELSQGHISHLNNTINTIRSTVSAADSPAQCQIAFVRVLAIKPGVEQFRGSSSPKSAEATSASDGTANN